MKKSKTKVIELLILSFLLFLLLQFTPIRELNFFIYIALVFIIAFICHFLIELVRAKFNTD